MSQAFIIMQIGNSELDVMCREVIVPALKALGLDPKRVDKHNEGRLLKSEIVSFIQDSPIIVADLTNERPNCYLEVGYAMGLDKFRNLILTARKDHDPDRPNRNPGDPKVHFDLSGYDILYWDPNDFDGFKIELQKRAKRRLENLASSVTTNPSQWDKDWLLQQQSVALAGLLDVKKTPKPGFMELRFTLLSSRPNKSQRELSEAARDAQIETFGWPIGAVLNGNDEYRPRPSVDGIVVKVAAHDHLSYDYWALRRDGDFYLLQSLFEDQRESGSIYFNTRIVRVTEALQYCARLYKNLGVSDTTRVQVAIKHGGLKGRHIKASSGNWPALHLDLKQPTTEEEQYAEIAVPLGKIESNLPELVKELTAPLFMLFDFFEVTDQGYAYIVNNFIKGTVI